MKRGKRISNVPREQIIAQKMYLGRRSTIKEIADSLGISVMTMYRWIRMNNWESIYKQKYEKFMIEAKKIEDPIKHLISITHMRTPNDKLIVKKRCPKCGQNIEVL